MILDERCLGVVKEEIGSFPEGGDGARSGANEGPLVIRFAELGGEDSWS